MISANINRGKRVPILVPVRYLLLKKGDTALLELIKTPTEWEKIYYLLLDKTGCFLILLLSALVLLCPQFEFLFLCNVRVVQKCLLYNGSHIMYSN